MSSENKKIFLFGVHFDALDRTAAVAACLRILRAGDSGQGARYVVPSNVDCVVQMQGNPAFLQACAAAELVLADGNPVVWASRLLGCPLPCRVTGSDLVPALFAAAGQGGAPVRVFLLGAGPGVAERAAGNIHQEYSGVRVVGCDSPPFGFHLDPAENDRIVKKINESGAELLIIGLGAPKQELWIHAHAARLHTRLAICSGATIDFMAGEQKRAPEWVRSLALEWLYRMLSDPKRLFKRYAKDAVCFPVLVAREYFRLRRSGS